MFSNEADEMKTFDNIRVTFSLNVVMPGIHFYLNSKANDRMNLFDDVIMRQNTPLEIENKQFENSGPEFNVILFQKYNKYGGIDLARIMLYSPEKQIEIYVYVIATKKCIP